MEINSSNDWKLKLPKPSLSQQIFYKVHLFLLNMELQKAIKSRTSIKRFQGKKPDWRKIIEAIDSARFAPMAGNLFTLKFILIDKPEIIQKIAKACQQNFVSSAKYLVVACSEFSKTQNAFGKKAETYSRQQAGAGIQNFLLSLQEKKLSTCWVGHFAEDQIKRELKIPGSANIEAIFPIGHAFEKNPKQKRKINLDQALYFNSYGNKRMKPLRKMNV